MFNVNEDFLALPGGYLFAEIRRRVGAFAEKHGATDIISLGIGDVTQPLAPTVVAALHEAVDHMATPQRFQGYGPEQGYEFLREAIADHDYAGLNISAGDIFVSDGAKCDVGNFQELFAGDSVIAVTDPVYPVYVDSNVMAGRTGSWDGTRWSEVVYLPCTAANDFTPDFPKRVPDVIYLCYPNNPTGTVLTREALTAWVHYARKHGCLILYDAAYEAYITDASIPRSIYEIDGAQEVAVEFRSFSKTAGFTGLRCAFVVVPAALRVATVDRKRVSLRDMWLRRQTTKYNGCPYVVQKAAAAVYSEAGRREIRATVGAYMDNAGHMRQALAGMGLTVFGGVHAPYLWVQTPGGADSWEFFQRVLEEARVVCTPGVGFGPSGQGYVRFTAFGQPDKTAEALTRMGRCVG